MAELLIEECHKARHGGSRAGFNRVDAGVTLCFLVREMTADDQLKRTRRAWNLWRAKALLPVASVMERPRITRRYFGDLFSAETEGLWASRATLEAEITRNYGLSALELEEAAAVLGLGIQQGIDQPDSALARLLLQALSLSSYAPAVVEQEAEPIRRTSRSRLRREGTALVAGLNSLGSGQGWTRSKRRVRSC